MNLKTHFDLVIFDWAGTMVDFGCEAPVKALLEAFAAESVRIDEATARRDMGKSKKDHVAALLADPTVAAAWREAHGRTPAAAGHRRPHDSPRTADAPTRSPGRFAHSRRVANLRATPRR
jgi:phosphonoacetaldehyde hydrolase